VPRDRGRLAGGEEPEADPDERRVGAADHEVSRRSLGY
jgi:hypothetical protein